MNKEIESLINNLEGCIGAFDYLLTPVENNLLLIYIKELQQENEKLNHYKKLYQILKREKEELRKWLEEHWEQSQDIWFVKIINKMKELERDDYE